MDSMSKMNRRSGKHDNVHYKSLRNRTVKGGYTVKVGYTVKGDYTVKGGYMNETPAIPDDQAIR